MNCFFRSINISLKVSMFVWISVPLCMLGEEWNGTLCVKCQLDHYKSVVGNNVSCEMCPSNETAPDVGYPACGKKLHPFL